MRRLVQRETSASPERSLVKAILVPSTAIVWLSKSSRAVDGWWDRLGGSEKTSCVQLGY